MDKRISIIKEYCFENDLEYHDNYLYVSKNEINDILNNLVNNDYKFDNRHLEIACKFYALDSIKFLLNKKMLQMNL